MRKHQVITCLGAVFAFTVGACEPAADSWLDMDSASQAIYYGTREPQNTTLSDGEMLAIGWLFTPGSAAVAWCSGTIIAPRVVSSAEHCLNGVSHVSQVGFGVGTYPSNPAATFSISEVYTHSSLDVALFILDEDATARVPELVPIPANRQHPNQWLNLRMDAAGYGRTHDGSTGRFFASVWLEGIDNHTVEVNGRGEQGICFGDSGGPLLASGPVVVAVESYGDSNCVGRDVMKRLDTLASWIDPIVSHYSPIDECDGLDYLGRCVGDVAEWCEDGQIRQHDCSADGMTCGYVDDEVGYFCVADACNGLDDLGRCDGDVLEWCENGQISQYDCSNDGMTCDYVGGETGYACIDSDEDTCGDLDYLGRCDGDVVEWCDDGRVRRHDCSNDGMTCGYVDNEVGYWCVETEEDPCATLDFLGRCNGDVAEWCEDGELRRYDCANDDMTCGYVDDEMGYYCLNGDSSDVHISGGCQTVEAASNALALGLLLSAIALVFRSRRPSRGVLYSRS